MSSLFDSWASTTMCAVCLCKMHIWDLANDIAIPIREFVEKFRAKVCMQSKSWEWERERACVCTLTLNTKLIGGTESARIFYRRNCVCVRCARATSWSLCETDTATLKKVAALYAVRPNITLAVTVTAYTANIQILWHYDNNNNSNAPYYMRTWHNYNVIFMLSAVVQSAQYAGDENGRGRYIEKNSAQLSR